MMIYFMELEEVKEVIENNCWKNFNKGIFDSSEDVDLMDEFKGEFKFFIISYYDKGIHLFMQFLMDFNVGDEYTKKNGETIILEEKHFQYVEKRLKIFEFVRDKFQEMYNQIDFEGTMEGN